MEAVDHDRAFAKRVKVPQAVGREFVEADEGRGGKKEEHRGKEKPRGYGR